MTDVLCVVLPSTFSDLTGDYRAERFSRNEVAKAVFIESDVHAFTKGRAASQGTKIAPSCLLDQEQVKPGISTRRARCSHLQIIIDD
jgi:hypothetical protein